MRHGPITLLRRNPHIIVTPGEIRYYNMNASRVKYHHQEVNLKMIVIFHELNARASSDVAGMAPQIHDGDDATQQGATGGFQCYVGVKSINTKVSPIARLKWLQRKVYPEDAADDDARPDLVVTARVDGLMNEFRENDEIIYIRGVPSGSEYTPPGP